MHVAKVKTSNQFQTLTRTDEETSEGQEGQEGQDYQAVKIKKNRVTGRQWKQVKISPKAPVYPRTDSPIEKLVSPKATNPRSELKVRKSPTAEPEVKLIATATRSRTSVCQMTFHLTDANKILASVNKMTDSGNEVVFNKVRSYIVSPSGRKAYLNKRNGVYILDVIFFNGDEAVRGEVIIDSGAADHVMPKGMLENVFTREKEAGIKFVAADGAEIGNYGRKDVQFVPADFWEEEFGSPFTRRA